MCIQTHTVTISKVLTNHKEKCMSLLRISPVPVFVLTISIEEKVQKSFSLIFCVLKDKRALQRKKEAMEVKENEEVERKKQLNKIKEQVGQ